jgi:hypothetical protein
LVDTYDNVTTTNTSDAICTVGFSRARLYYDFSKANSPTSITIIIIGSDNDGVTYDHENVNDHWNFYRLTATYIGSGGKKEYVALDFLPKHFKIKIDTADTTASATFTVNSMSLEMQTT